MSLTSRLSISVTFGLLLSLSTPFIIPAVSHDSSIAIAQAPTQSTQTQPTAFSDVPADYWAHDYIEGLADLNIVSGFPDGTFHPTDNVSRAQFAAILRQAFLQSQPASALTFKDVPANSWAAEAISAARSSGFLTGYPDNTFKPYVSISRADALLSLATGLKYTGTDDTSLSRYNDVYAIPDYALAGMAAAAEANITIPDYFSDPPNQLLPRSPAKRADVAAFVYQALVHEGRATPITLPFDPQNTVEIPTAAKLVSFSNSGQQLATLSPTGDKIQVWNPQTAALISEKAADAGTEFVAVVLSPEGTRVAAVTKSTTTSALTLNLWNAQTKATLWEQPLSPDQSQWNGDSSERGLPRDFGQIAFAPAGDLLVVQLYLNDSPLTSQVRLYSAATGEVVHSLKVHSSADNISYSQFAFSPDGRLLVGAGRSVSYITEPGDSSYDNIDVWQVNEGKFLHSFNPTADLTEGGGSPSPALAYSDGSPTPALAEGGGGFPYELISIAFAPDGELKVLSRSSFSGYLDTWNVLTKEKTASAGAGSDRTDETYAVSPDGRYVLFGGGDNAAPRLIDSQTGFIRGVPSSRINNGGMPSYLSPVPPAFSPNGDYLAIPTQVPYWEDTFQPKVYVLSKD